MARTGYIGATRHRRTLKSQTERRRAAAEASRHARRCRRSARTPLRRLPPTLKPSPSLSCTRLQSSGGDGVAHYREAVTAGAVRVGVLGCGNVGGGLVHLLTTQTDDIEART